MESVPVWGFCTAAPDLEYLQLSLIFFVKPIEKYLAF
jgi:hypothetical protein